MPNTGIICIIYCLLLLANEKGSKGRWRLVSLSCPYLFITSNNPIYLTSLLIVGTGYPVRGPSGLGPGVKLLHGSTCYNFPPYVGCVVI